MTCHCAQAKTLADDSDHSDRSAGEQSENLRDLTRAIPIASYLDYALFLVLAPTHV